MKNSSYLVLLCLAQFIIMSDNMGMLLSIGTFHEVFNATTSQMNMSQMLFAIISPTIMPISGVLGLLIGVKLLFRIGVIVLAISEIILISSYSMNVVFIARITSGLAAGILVPSTLSLLVLIYKGKQRAIAFSVLGTVLSIASLIIPISVGTISSIFGWRIPFVIILILSIFVLFLSNILSKNIEIKENFKFDIIGSILIVLSIGCILFGISKFSDWGVLFAKEDSTGVFGISIATLLFFLGICIFIVLIFYEIHFEYKHKCTCVFPIAFFKDRVVVLGFILVSLTFFLLGGSSYIYILYMQTVLHFSSAKTGLIYSLYSVSAFIAALVVHKMCNYTSLKTAIRIAIISSSSGLFISIFGILKFSINYYFFAPGLLLSGFGAGCALVIAPILITNNLADKYAQQSGGIQSLLRNIGQMFGIALNVLLLSIFMSNELRIGLSKDKNISQNNKEIILNIDEVKRGDFHIELDQSHLKSLGIEEESNINIIDELKEINLISQKNSVRKTIFCLSLVVLSIILFTFEKGQKSRINIIK